MTEQEAKTKWCFAAVASHTDPRRGFNDHEKEKYPATFPCIGSACMAWRWEDEDAYEQLLTEWEDAANIGGITDRGPEPVRGGFCGLAGKP